jgi:hypothetical protein
MHNCSNCNGAFDVGVGVNDGLLIRQGEVLVGAICPDCVSGVKTCKVVLKRNDIGRLVYEQYSALEMEKKAFGKSA